MEKKKRIRFRPARIRDITGQRFGRLVAAEIVPWEGSGTRWRCVCDCGGEKIVGAQFLGNGHVRDCGCVMKMRERLCLKAAVQRCHNPKSAEYHVYGGRGISVCEEWRTRDGFEAFLAHIGPAPTKKHTIDRINNDGNYEPGNVRWATLKEQHTNRKDNVNLTAFGKTQCLEHWAIEHGLYPSTVKRRLDAGMTVEDALTEPSNYYSEFSLIAYDGKCMSAKAWSGLCGFSPKVVIKRLRKGWSVHQALTVPSSKTPDSGYRPEGKVDA